MTRDSGDSTDSTPIDRDHYEESPSTGAEETVRILGGREGYDHEPSTGDDEPVTIDAVPPAERPTPSEVFA